MSSLSHLDLSSLAPVFILATHLPMDDLHEAEERLCHAHGRLTYDGSEARIFLGSISKKKRANFDLRALGVWTEESEPAKSETTFKRRKLNDPLMSERNNNELREGQESETVVAMEKKKSHVESAIGLWPNLEHHVMVLKLDWLDDCLKKNIVLPYDPYLVYFGRITARPANEPVPEIPLNTVTHIKIRSSTHKNAMHPNHNTSADAPELLSRSNPDTDLTVSLSSGHPRFGYRRRFGQGTPQRAHLDKSAPPKLHRTTTSEFSMLENDALPPLPSWMLEPHPRHLYSCLRSTLSTNPNTYFIAQLTKIKEARILTLDEIGVRAYSTSIASLAAYPHRITSPLEVSRLPGCDQKIAALWVEWHESVSQRQNIHAFDLTSDAKLDVDRTVAVVRELDSNPDVAVLRTFYQIWGCGADTARKFYYTNGWKDLDDIVEFGWNQLTRLQQIGVKFYDEFKLPIPRSEVEEIATTIQAHARKIRNIPSNIWSKVPSWKDGQGKHTDPRDFVCVIVGSYRRGNASSGDVDVILTHRDDNLTKNLIVDLVSSLETSSHITHTLTLHTTTSDRHNSTLPFRADTTSHHSFDSLDKVLCVWQNPCTYTPTSPSPSPSSSSAPHRRVDIIISPWRTIGAAVLGWSAGTTFERDIRRWVKREKGWKFDSSGVRDRGDGRVVDLETLADGVEGGDGWEDRERRVMEGLGIGWRPPEERCTG